MKTKTIHEGMLKLKKSRIALLTLLALSMISVSACSSSSNKTDEKNEPTNSTSSTSETSTDADNKDAEKDTAAAADNTGTALSEATMPKIELKNKKVKFLFWGDQFGTQLDPEKPWIKNRFNDLYGGELEVVKPGSGGLFALIAAGDAPDIVLDQSGSFPSFIMRDIVQPWDAYINYDNPIWNDARSSIDFMKWNDKIYNLTTKFHNLGVMYYNKRMIDEAGLEDPMSLQAKGQWTWDKLKEYAIDLTQDNDKDGTIDVYGLGVSDDFAAATVISTGEDFINYENGKFTNNLKSPAIKDAMDFLYGLGVKGANVVSTDNYEETFPAGKVAMTFANDWKGWANFKDMWNADGLGVVPFPKYPKADKQYQASLADYYWLLKDAKNPEGAGAFMLANNYDIALNVDPSAPKDPKEAAVKQFMEWGIGTKESAEAIYSIPKELPSKLIVSRSIGMDFYEEGKLPKYWTTPWSTLADEIYQPTEEKIKAATKPFAPEDALK
jgi:hypothetical protein